MKSSSLPNLNFIIFFVRQPSRDASLCSLSGPTNNFASSRRRAIECPQSFHAQDILRSISRSYIFYLNSSRPGLTFILVLRYYPCLRVFVIQCLRLFFGWYNLPKRGCEVSRARGQKWNVEYDTWYIHSVSYRLVQVSDIMSTRA